MMMTCKLKNQTEETARLQPFIRTCIDRFELPADWEMRINLAIEEAVVNVMQYAFDDREEHEICLEAERKDNVFTLTVSDGGRAFNPLEAPEADTTLNAEEREIGGLGIHLIRSLADEVTYRRESGRNVLSLHFVCKKMPHPKD